MRLLEGAQYVRRHRGPKQPDVVEEEHAETGNVGGEQVHHNGTGNVDGEQNHHNAEADVEDPSAVDSALVAACT